MTDNTRKVYLSTELDTRPVKDGAREIVSTMEGMAAGVKGAADKAGKAVDNIGTGADASAQKLDRSTKSIISSIQRVTAQMEAGEKSGSKYFETLAQQRGVNVDALRPYLQQLDAAKAKQDAAAASMGKMGVSAAQTAAALRGVPAQFTDIFTSLQGGQAPLTVLLQQGGQLKDMFGGVGNAAKALGGYVVGLINPFTIAAGAVGALGYAAYQGAGELQAFNKSLILTGNTAGVTGDRLMGIAASIASANGAITQGKAAEALNALIEAGVRGEAQLGRYARAAAEFEKAGGSAASEVAKQFAALGKDPLAASLKLNEAMGYLSSSTFETIRSLEAQGKTIDAARVAQNAYASAIEDRTPQLVQNIGLIESAWRSVSSAMAQVWDTAKNIGRPDTLQQRVGSISGSIDSYQRLAAGGGLLGQYAAGQIDPLRAQQASLRRQLESQTVAADLTAQQAQKEKERTKFLGEADKFLTSEQRQRREILQVQNLLARQTITQKEAEERIAAIRASGAKKGSGSGRNREGDPFASERAAAKEWADYTQKFGDLTADAEGKVMGLNKAQQLLVEYLKSPAYNINSQAMREKVLQDAYAADAAIKLADALKLEAQFLKIVADKEREWDQETIKRNQSAEQMIAQIELETSLLGLSTQEREQVIAFRELERLGIEKNTVAYAKYTDQLQKAMEDRQKKQAQIDYWNQVNSVAQSTFEDIAMNGEDAFKRIGESIKREVIRTLYELTVKQWIIQIAGASGVNGVGGTNSILTQAVQSYFSGGSSGAGAAAGAASAAGTTVAAGGVSAGTSTAAGTTAAAGSTTAAAGSSSWLSSAGAYAGYAAIIYALVQYAQKLYAQGYNREALGYGSSGSVTRFGNYSSYQSDPNMGKSGLNYSPAMTMTNDMRKLNDALGMSQKWSDILSGTTRMATLIGRRLTEVGLQANINDGAVDVQGYAKYKGGLFRSNKTVGIEADPRDTAMLKAEVEAMQNGTKAMAAAMGYSTEAIDHFTGKLKVDFKGVESNAEASERLQKAMDDLQFSMLKAASGGKLSRDEFDKFMTGVQDSIKRAGISAEGISDILVNGMMTGLSGEEIGAQLSQMVIGGIYKTIAEQAFAPVASSIMAQIVTPIFTAMMAGVPLAQAVSQQAIDSVMVTAQTSIEMLASIFSSEWFQSAMAMINESMSGISEMVAGIDIPDFSMPEIDQAAENRAREREQLEREILRLQGNTAELRARELMDIDESNRALQERVWALEDEAEAIQQVKDLQSAWTDLTGSIEDEIKRLRGLVAGDSAAGIAYVQAQFAIATGQARAMDQTAAGKLPGLSGQLADLYLNTATSRSDYQARVSSLAASLEETNRITRGTAGIGADNAQKVTDQNVADKIVLLQKSIDALTAKMDENTSETKTTNNTLKTGVRTIVLNQ